MNYKPNSVLNGYLSSPIVADKVKRREGRGRTPTISPCLAPSGVYRAYGVTTIAVGFYPTFPSLPPAAK